METFVWVDEFRNEGDEGGRAEKVMDAALVSSVGLVAVDEFRAWWR